MESYDCGPLSLNLYGNGELKLNSNAPVSEA